MVLGTGNVLFGDEGLGVHLASLLRRNYRFNSVHQVEVVDGGTLGPHLIPLLAEQDRVLLLDTIKAEESEPGEVFCFDYEKVPARVNWQGSAHEVEMRQTLAMMKMAGDLPRITVLAAVPEIISETSFKLTPPLLRAAALMESKALALLTEWEVAAERIDTVSVEQIARNCCRGYTVVA
ncbi:MAG: HyaD/HybD family hydrogenase maturation endopeptidase [Desulfurivibrio sp.]